MIPNRTDSHFLDQYLENKEQFYGNKYIAVTNMAVCIFLYEWITYVQSHNISQELNGIFAQLQVMVSVYLGVSAQKKGYIIACVLNGFQSLLIAVRVFIYGDVFAAPGIVVPIGTIITITIIFIFARRINLKLQEIKKQKEELVALYEEIATNGEELNRQNEMLLEYNRVMEEKEEKLNYLAFFDVLTELPNRKMIIDRLDLLISLSSQKPINFAVVFIDLDNFKKINDSMGHQAGDSLLQDIAVKLKAKSHPDDMLGRLGGDEFALIIQRELKEEEILECVEKLKSIFVVPVSIERAEFNISASFGISLYPQDGDTSMELLKCADTAMYKAKDWGKNGIQFFNQEMLAEIIGKIEFENRLLSSIQNEELSLAFQPQYFSESKRLRGVEVLVRWKSPELGNVSPLLLIPVAEETGFIIPMGEWILRKACVEFKCLQNAFCTDAVLSVNLSAVQIMEPSFVQMVKRVLEETGFNGQHLEVEITESVFISSITYVVEVLNELRALGIRVALDDFGTGYSSLNYLQLLPIDTLKIDKSFIDNIIRGNARKQIVGSIISLVHRMDILVVAEGVETEAQLNYLIKQKCDCIQGFLWGKPLNQNELFRLLQQTANDDILYAKKLPGR